MRSSFVRTALLVVPVMLLAACGGGGGGGGSGGSSSGGSTTAAGVVITTGNAPAVAAEAVQVSTSTDAAGASTFVTGVQVSGSGGADPLQLATAARMLAGKVPGSATLATGAAATQACTGGGSITMDATTSGSGSLAAGDSFRITASNCTESSGTAKIVMNGSITISIVSGSYNPASTTYPKSVTMRIVTSNFSVTGGGMSEVYNGDMTMALTENSATSASITLSGASLASQVGSHTVTLMNYSMSVSESSGARTMSVGATVQTTNTRLASTAVSYTISTVTPITVSATGAVTAGAIKVTGAGSALLLTVTSTDTFSLQVDTNGDGSYESTSTVTRSQLQALI